MTPAFYALVGGGPRRNIAMTFGTEKLDLYGYLKMKKMKICLVVSTEYTNVTDTDRRTDTARRHRPRLRIASRGKIIA